MTIQLDMLSIIIYLTLVKVHNIALRLGYVILNHELFSFACWVGQLLVHKVTFCTCKNLDPFNVTLTDVTSA